MRRAAQASNRTSAAAATSASSSGLWSRFAGGGGGSGSNSTKSQPSVPAQAPAPASEPALAPSAPATPAQAPAPATPAPATPPQEDSNPKPTVPENPPKNDSGPIAPIPVPSIARVAASAGTSGRKRSGSTAVSPPLPPLSLSTTPTHPPPSDTPTSSSDTLRPKPAAAARPSPIVDHTPNILVFGETGAGKSSIINMLSGTVVAGVSSAASGCTLESQSYLVALDGQSVRLWDTAGLNDGVTLRNGSEQVMRNLRDLVGMLSEGVSLLVYCVRGTARFREVWKANYDLFWSAICETRVPIVIVVTGMEHQKKPMESWWVENGEQFGNRGMTFVGHACVVATKGKSGNFRVNSGEVGRESVRMSMYEAEYEASRAVVRKLVLDHFARSPVRWIEDREVWLADVSTRLDRYYDRSAAAAAATAAESAGGGGQGSPYAYLWFVLFVLSLVVVIVLATQGTWHHHDQDH